MRIGAVPDERAGMHQRIASEANALAAIQHGPKVGQALLRTQPVDCPTEI
jgi:hypothetical protein